MDKYDKITKYRKQLEYIEKLFDILQETEDGGLYDDFTEYESQKFIDFADFMSDIQMNIEHKLKLLEVKQLWRIMKLKFI